MDAFIDPDWPAVDKATFEELLSQVNWKRDGWGNGDCYMAIGRTVQYPNGYITKLQVAFHDIGCGNKPDRYLINPEFFKPA